MNHNSTFDKIEAYLLHQLTEQERVDFEAELLVNEQLAQQFKEQEMEHKMMEILVEKDLRNELKKWESEDETPLQDTPQPIRRIPFYRHPFFLAVAASMAILLALLIWYHGDSKKTLEIVDQSEHPSIQKAEELPINTEEKKEDVVEEEFIKEEDNPPSPSPKQNDSKEKDENRVVEQPKKEPVNIPEKPTTKEEKKQPNYIALADNYIKPVDVNTIRVRSSGSPFGAALSALKDGKLEEAIIKLSEILSADSTHLNAHYYLGLAYYQKAEYKKAIPHLVTTSRSKHLQVQKARWWLVLSYLKAERSEGAISLLQKIVREPSHFEYENAEALLKELIEK